MRRILCALTAGLLAIPVMLGCGSDISIPLPIYNPPRPYVPLPASVATYRAYGDSITAGAGVPVKTLAYPNLIATDLHLALSNYAISGDQACDVATRQIFPNRDDSAAQLRTFSSLLIGTNDADVKGIGGYEAVFTRCHQAAVSWLALPSDRKVQATSSAVVTHGPGVIESANNWNAWETASVGASISFPITLLTAGPIYIWPRIADGDTGAFSYAVDGQICGAFATGTSPAIHTQNATSDSLAFLRVPGIAAGPHTVTLTQTTSQGTMRIVAVGAPTASASSIPTLVLANVPRQQAGGNCGRSPLICIDYTAIVISDVSVFYGDGLDVRYAQNYSYMQADSSDMFDSIHPNALGQSELRAAFEAAVLRP